MSGGAGDRKHTPTGTQRCTLSNTHGHRLQETEIAAPLTAASGNACAPRSGTPSHTSTVSPRDAGSDIYLVPTMLRALASKAGRSFLPSWSSCTDLPLGSCLARIRAWRPCSHLGAFAPAAVPSAWLVLPVGLRQAGSFPPSGLRAASPAPSHYPRRLFYFFTTLCACVYVCRPHLEPKCLERRPRCLPRLPAPAGALRGSGSS